MINEGLGGGFIIHEYDVKKFEQPKTFKTPEITPAPVKKETFRDIDRMIDEGLGGGFIIYDYDRAKFEKPQIKKDGQPISA
jgi:hypothetical protein